MVYLDGKLVEESVIDPAKHKFAGAFRPPALSEYQGKGYIACPCGSMLQTFQQSSAHWQQGCFDVPQYFTYTSSTL